MLTFSNFRIECWLRNNGERMVALHMEDIDLETNRVVYVEGRGINYVWFVMTWDEFTGVCNGKVSDVGDGYHKLAKSGELWTFYDLQLDFRGTFGKLSVPYVNINIPHRIARVLHRYVDRCGFTGLENGGERKHLTIPLSTRKRWDSQYGQRKGKVKIDYHNHEATHAFFEECLANGGETFKRSIDNVVCIAQNSTYSVWETATVRIAKDWDGFYWVACDPRGVTIMNGGIINHGARNGGHDWSVHT